MAPAVVGALRLTSPAQRIVETDTLRVGSRLGAAYVIGDLFPSQATTPHRMGGRGISVDYDGSRRCCRLGRRSIRGHPGCRRESISIVLLLLRFGFWGGVGRLFALARRHPGIIEVALWATRPHRGRCLWAAPLSFGSRRCVSQSVCLPWRSGHQVRCVAFFGASADRYKAIRGGAGLRQSEDSSQLFRRRHSGLARTRFNHVRIQQHATAREIRAGIWRAWQRPTSIRHTRRYRALMEKHLPSTGGYGREVRLAFMLRLRGRREL